ncbi:MAG: hypothetical protein CMI82_01040 [Candidatus Pelagibacter sp.]|jgi:uncharacterized protein (DUF1330 family)|nr:hypothetical protein [Candidatus Pelagibacter sp.]|tara:strand:+ start:1037 stop:1324 length:288 start_codon:yes stop_codon:yes gene_type:complete
MTKGYMVADLHVRDKEGLEKFRKMAKPILEEYGGKALVRTPNAEAREGKKTGVVVVIEFESMDQARKCYELEAYQVAKAVRDKACDTDLFLAEGV